MKRSVVSLITQLLFFAVLSSYGQTCCEASGNCSSCNSGSFQIKCVAPVVAGQTGCNCTTQFPTTCPCVKCTWTWVANGNGMSQTSTSNCGSTNLCRNEPNILEAEKSIVARATSSGWSRSALRTLNASFFLQGAVGHPASRLTLAENDPISIASLANSRPELLEDHINGFKANVTNRGLKDIVALEVVWFLTIEGCNPAATSRRDFFFSGEPVVAAGQTIEIGSTVGGWPAEAVKNITAKISYYQLSDGTEYDAHLTNMSTQVKERRAKARDIYARVRLAGIRPESDKEVQAVLFDKALSGDYDSAVILNELRGIDKELGRDALIQFVNRNASK